MSSKKFGEDSQRSAGSASVRDARKKANERLGEWVKGKYRLDSLLGVGGMASVYAVTHRNGSRAALKILHAEFAREEAIKQRFLREGYVANKVSHPGVVSILDDDETEHGEPYLMMELLEGETLRQLWKRNKRKLSIKQALHVAAEVLDTLVPCHENKVIHRDLKPANVFLCTDGVVKLLDFGVAQLREEGEEALTRAGTALGTPSYMAPEQAQGNSHNLDGRADLFSVGAMLYTMLSGKRLLQGKSPNEAFILAATQPAPSLARKAPHLPVEVIALVDKALKWDRRKRFKNAAMMRDACRQIIEHAEAGGSIQPIARGGDSTVPPASSRPPKTTEPPTRSASPAAARKRGPASGKIPDIPLTQIADAPEADAPPAGRRRKRSRAAMAAAEERRRGREDKAARSKDRVAARARQKSAPELDKPKSSRRKTSRPALKAPPKSKKPRASTAERTPVSGVEARVNKSAPPPDFELIDEPAAKTQPREGESPLVEMFERFEKSLTTLRVYGLHHPEGVSKVKVVHRAFLDALQVTGGVRFQVHPFCFTEGKVTVWEPGHPNDQIPYGLASSGVEEIRITKGVSKDEVREFIQITVIDPQLGLTEGDIGAALWEAGFEHILCKVRDDLTDADAREQIRFFSESEEVEADIREDLARVVSMMAQTARPNLRHQDQVEAAAMALTTDTEMFEASQMASDAMRLDYAAAKALASELTIEAEEWRDRFFDVSPTALADAAMREDLDIIWTELDHYVDRWVRAGMWPLLLDTYDRLIATLTRFLKTEEADVDPADITKRVFTWPRVAAIFGYLDSDKAEAHVAKQLSEALSIALAAVDDNMVSDMLRLADNLGAGPLCELALGYVGQHMDTRRDEILLRLNDLRPELAQRVLAAVAEEKTDANRELLKPLLMSTNPAIRCEATALLAQSPEELGKQLVRLLTSSDPRLRSASLTTMLRHEVRHAGPGLVQAIEDPSALERPGSELRQMLDTLYSLHPSRAESLLISIVKDHGLMSNDALDRKRAIAAEVLCRNADNANPIDALEGATRIRPWNTQLLRTAASEALGVLRDRLAKRQAAGAKS